MLFTLYATPCVGDVVALVSQNPRIPKGRVFLYGELLCTCREIMSEHVFYGRNCYSKKFMVWSEFKVRPMEMLFVLIFFILMNLFDREFNNLP